MKYEDWEFENAFLKYREFLMFLYGYRSSVTESEIQEAIDIFKLRYPKEGEILLKD